jgi:uncharacterized protein (DUF58 family)
VRRAAAVVVAGLALILVALLFDASPLFVPGIAITLLGAVAPAWVSLAARGATIERKLESERVIEDEPIEATIEVTRGHWGLPGAAVADPLAGEPVSIRGPMSLISGGTTASVRIVASFPRRGLRRVEPPTLIVSDALELARVVRLSASPPQELLVLPRTERVKWVPGAGEKWRRAEWRHRARRPSPLPPGHAGVPDPLGGARARGWTARATAASRHRDASARRRRRPE